LRVLTCNIKGHGDKNEQLDALIRQSQADIVALQGCWDEIRVQWPGAWHVVRSGELLVASRFPLQEVTATAHARTGFSQPRANLLSCTVSLPEGELRFATVHLQSPHYGISHVLDRKTGIRPSRSDLIAEEIAARWQESEEVAAQLAADGRPDIVVGDLNLPVESPIYRTFWSTWSDAFSAAGWGWGGTEWPHPVAGIRFGVRIDHVLSGPSWRPRRCWLGPDIGSDHLPLLADLCQSKSAP
jgi:endonuclease/exonuclease/phosphatase (EEP) superfamily protein YafD